MDRSRLTVIALFVIGTMNWRAEDVSAQRTYIGSTPAELQYGRSGGIDANGRAANVDVRTVDRNGYFVDDYGRRFEGYGVPGHYHGSGYAPGGYYPSVMDGSNYSASSGYAMGVGSSSGGYAINSGRLDPTLGAIRTNVSPPRTMIVGGPFPARTVLNNSTRGGVIEYTHNGNGYIYSPGSSSQTVISSGPSIFPQISVVQPTQPPVIIETRPTVKDSAVVQSRRNVAQINLSYPIAAASPLSYFLNGTVYSIKPGYSQTFDNDRDWTIEFLRGGNGSQPMRYLLKAGVYNFVLDENGWDLKQFQASAVNSPPPLLPRSPSPAPAPIPAPDL